MVPMIQCNIYFFFLKAIMVGTLKYYKIQHKKKLLPGNTMHTNCIFMNLLHHYFIMVDDSFNNISLTTMSKLNQNGSTTYVSIKTNSVKNFTRVYMILSNQE